MDTSVENTIKESFVSFYKAMNDWCLYCNNLDKDETLTYLEKTNKQKKKVILTKISSAVSDISKNGKIFETLSPKVTIVNTRIIYTKGYINC